MGMGGNPAIAGCIDMCHRVNAGQLVTRLKNISYTGSGGFNRTGKRLTER
jgi:hypothetical protein